MLSSTHETSSSACGQLALLATLAGLDIKAMNTCLPDPSTCGLLYMRNLRVLSVAFEACYTHKYKRPPSMAQ